MVKNDGLNLLSSLNNNILYYVLFIIDDPITNDHRFQLLEKDFNLFSQLFIIFLFFYVNLNLKKATFIVSFT